MLRINNMVANDAGMYEAKINSISDDSNSNILSDCDSLVLPLLEALAGHAPVTFTVQEQFVPAYDPSFIVSTLNVTDDTADSSTRRIELRRAPLSSPLLERSGLSGVNVWSMNATHMFTGRNQTFSLTYTNTATVIGDYSNILWSSIPLTQCAAYQNYIRPEVDFPLQASYWTIVDSGE